MTLHQNPDGTPDRQRIIEEARSAIEAHRRMMADAGLTAEACVEALRRTEGEAAVVRVQQQVGHVLRGIEEHTAREVLYAASPRPVSRHVARRSIV